MVAAADLRLAEAGPTALAHLHSARDVAAIDTMDYLEYAYLQTAQERGAKQVVDELTSFRRSAAPNLPTAYAVAAIPVRYARFCPRKALKRETDRRFTQRGGSRPVPALERMIAYGRALGDARTGNIAGAETEVERLQSLEDKLKGNDTCWANQVEVQRLAAAGILAYVRGDDQKAVALVRAAADLDATMDKHPATPSPVLPARELLADLLLELNQPAAALVEYRAMLSTDPNRFRSLLGEARAAKQTGDSATAHDAYRKLVALSTPDGSARPELAEARSYLTN